MTGSRVVVGIDGSAGSELALRWAADEAARRAVELVVVHAYDYPYLHELGPETQRALEQRARAELDDELSRVLGAAPPVHPTTRVESGPPARVLLDLAADADLLVVGARGHGGVSGLLLGSVAERCARHARCPVVIVPHDA